MQGMSDHDILVEIRGDVRYIRETLTDHEGRIRILERQGDQGAALRHLEEVVDEHEDRIVTIEKRDSGRKAVAYWKDLTLSRLIAILTAVGGLGALVGWLAGWLSCFGGT
jgi:hypothetical protein